MKTQRVADLITDILHSAGVRRIYAVVGDSLNGITDSVRKHGDIEWIHTRHEEAAAFAAGAEAHLTGELAVCAGSCGPGNLHLINGLFEAHRSCLPVLAIAAQIPSAEIGRGYFQETHPDQLFRECSHYCELVSHPSQLPAVLEAAIRAAVGHRGVAVVVIPGDVALQKISAAASVGPAVAIELPSVVPSDRNVEALAKLLNTSKRITLLCGRGCAGAHEPLMQLADKIKSPIVHAFGGKEHVEYDNPFDVGMTGLIGFSSGYYAMLSCDTLLMLGTDFPYRQFYPTDAKIAQIDLRPEVLGRRTRLDLGLVGDLKATISALLPRLTIKADRSHLDQSLAHYRKAREGLDDLATGRPGSKLIHPQYLTKLISEHAAEDAVFTFDVGTPAIWVARYLKMNGHAAGHRGASGLSGSASYQPVGRWRLCDAYGRFPDAGAAKVASEDRCLQQRNARLRGAGNEGKWLFGNRNVFDQSGLCGNGPRHRRSRNPGRGSRRAARGYCRRSCT